MPVTGPNQLPAPVQETFHTTLLSVEQPYLIHSLAAERFYMPAHGGTTIRFRRYDRLAPNLVPLGGTGVTPPGKTITAIDLDATIDWYGDHAEIHEQIALTNQDAVLNETTIRLGVQMRETEDQLIKQMMEATVGQVNAVGGANGDNPTEPQLSDIQDMVQTLIGNNAKTLIHKVDGSDKLGTSPIRNAFMGLCHSDLMRSLEQINGFTNVTNYGTGNTLEAEWGSVSNVRFFISSLGSKLANASANAADVYKIFFCGVEGLGYIEQDKASSQLIYNGPEYSGPLRLYSSLAWKSAMVPRLLNERWVLALNCTQAV